MEFNDIFAEYYTAFRGQGTSIPVYGDREYTVAVHYANNGIKAWERADGQLWRELQETLQTASTGDKTLVDGTTGYDAPTDMRKPPAKVWFFNGNSTHSVDVIEPQDRQNYTLLADQAIFIGSANTGYTLVLGEALTTEFNGWGIDYAYTRKATLLSTTVDPGQTKVDMSDPNFLIQHMLVMRYTNARNGFGVKIADRERTLALANMKIENNSGTYGNAESLGVSGTGWGR